MATLQATSSEDRTGSEAGATDEDTKKDDGVDADLDDKIDVLKAQIDAIEREAERLRAAEAQASAAKDEIKSGGAAAGGLPAEVAGDELWRQRMQVDQRSIYVGQVDYGTTPDELAELLESCGTVNRVTILCDRWTGHPKGYAYVEFEEQSSVERALRLNGTLFRGRFLKVAPKRTNFPWWMTAGKGMGKGGAAGGRGRQAGGYGAYGAFARGRGGGGWWSPPYYSPYYSPWGSWGRGKGRGRGRGAWY